MTKILRICIVMLLAVLLLPVELSAQSRRDKEQTYVLDQPYEVTKITPPQYILPGQPIEASCFWITAR